MKKVFPAVYDAHTFHFQIRQYCSGHSSSYPELLCFSAKKEYHGSVKSEIYVPLILQAFDKSPY